MIFFYFLTPTREITVLTQGQRVFVYQTVWVQIDARDWDHFWLRIQTLQAGVEYQFPNHENCCKSHKLYAVSKCWQVMSGIHCMTDFPRKECFSPKKHWTWGWLCFSPGHHPLIRITYCCKDAQEYFESWALFPNGQCSKRRHWQEVKRIIHGGLCNK